MKWDLNPFFKPNLKPIFFTLNPLPAPPFSTGGHAAVVSGSAPPGTASGRSGSPRIGCGGCAAAAVVFVFVVAARHLPVPPDVEQMVVLVAFLKNQDL